MKLLLSLFVGLLSYSILVHTTEAFVFRVVPDPATLRHSRLPPASVLQVARHQQQTRQQPLPRTRRIRSLLDAATTTEAEAEAEADSDVSIPYDAAARLAFEALGEDTTLTFEDYAKTYKAEAIELVKSKGRVVKSSSTKGPPPPPPSKSKTAKSSKKNPPRPAPVPTPAPTPASTEQQQHELLTSILKVAAATGRGEYGTPAQQAIALEWIAQLEQLNPTLAPATDLHGRWELVYSSTQLFRSSPFFMAGRAVCTTPDQADQYDWFCDMHRKALAISNIGTVRQIINIELQTLTSEFEVHVGAIPFLNDVFPFAKYSGGLPVTIDGAIVSTADITPTDDGHGWELLMDTVEIKGSNIPGLRTLLDREGSQLRSRALGAFLETNVDGYTNPTPIFTTTYLSRDGTVRINRDQDGKVFVYIKEPTTTNADGDEEDTPADPTSYKTVSADLGLLKLLGGFNDAITKFYI